MSDFNRMVEWLCMRQRIRLHHWFQTYQSYLSKPERPSVPIQMHPTQERCMARIHNQTQCTRKWKDPITQLCGSHIHSTPYGRFNQESEQMNSSDPSQVVDLTQYLPTKVITIKGVDYLIDDNQIIYENNETNTIVGHKIESSGSYEWF